MVVLCPWGRQPFLPWSDRCVSVCLSDLTLSTGARVGVCAVRRVEGWLGRGESLGPTRGPWRRRRRLRCRRRSSRSMRSVITSAHFHFRGERGAGSWGQLSAAAGCAASRAPSSPLKTALSVTAGWERDARQRGGPHTGRDGRPDLQRGGPGRRDEGARPKRRWPSGFRRVQEVLGRQHSGRRVRHSTSRDVQPRYSNACV